MPSRGELASLTPGQLVELRKAVSQEECRRAERFRNLEVEELERRGDSRDVALLKSKRLDRYRQQAPIQFRQFDGSDIGCTGDDDMGDEDGHYIAVGTANELTDRAEVRVLIATEVNRDLAVTLLKKITATLEREKLVPAKPDVGRDTSDDLPF
jgi:hypothetical protein